MTQDVTKDGLLVRLRRRARPILFVALLGAGVPLATSGCYGRFPLTHIVYELNGDISDDKWIQTIVFWVFAILPVYDIAILGDAIILNLIEFWTGETVDTTSVEQQDGTRVTFGPGERKGVAVLTVERDGAVIERRTFVKLSSGEIEMRDAQGVVAGRIFRNEDGSLDLADANGAKLDSISADAIASLASR